MKRISILILVLCTCLFSAGWLQAQAAHKIIEFDVKGAGTGTGQGTLGFAILDDGWIMGGYIDSSNVHHGFLRPPNSKIIPFDPPGSVNTFPNGVRSDHTVVGGYSDSNGVAHGFLRTPAGNYTRLDDPAAGKSSGQGTFCGDINTKGQIAGAYIDSNGVYHGFLYKGGNYTTLDDPNAGKGSGQGTFPSGLTGLTETGAISGGYADSNGMQHGFLLPKPHGNFENFDPPGSVNTFVSGIDSKLRVGGSYIVSNKVRGFFRVAPKKYTRFDAAPNAAGTQVNNVGSDGTIVGDYFDTNGVLHGFFRAPTTGHITKFDVPGAGTGSGQGTVASTNNSKGWITGNYIDSNGVNHGFLRE